MFDYFHARDNEQYLFLQMPIMLIKDEKFKGLSDGAKILYSLLLNRTSLSAKNGWTDNEGRVYIIYTIEEIMADLNCWEKKATKSMKELREIGLVRSIRQGLGKPNLIYVMNFATTLRYETNEPQNPRNSASPLNCQKDNSGVVKRTIQEPVKSTIQELSKGQSIYIDINKDLQSNNNQSVMSCQTSDCPQIKNDLTRHDATDTDDAEQIKFEEKEKGLSQSQTEQSHGLNERPSETKILNVDQYTTYSEFEARVKYNIDYTFFTQEHHPYIKLIDTIVHNVLDILAETNDFITLNKKKNKRIRTTDAKEICLRLKYDHILYVVEKFKDISVPITNKGNYLKSLILSSLTEMEAYYHNEYRQGNLQYL